jgi:hypothetical protein
VAGSDAAQHVIKSAHRLEFGVEALELPRGFQGSLHSQVLGAGAAGLELVPIGKDLRVALLPKTATPRDRSRALIRFCTRTAS